MTDCQANCKAKNYHIPTIKGDTRISDNPFICPKREHDKCTVPEGMNTCPEKDMKGTCCIVCKLSNTCYSCCMKVMSYLAVQKDNPSSRWSDKHEEEIKLLEREADKRILGNPSKRSA